jgi:hypothetical protein
MASKRRSTIAWRGVGRYGFGQPRADMVRATVFGAQGAALCPGPSRAPVRAQARCEGRGLGLPGLRLRGAAGRDNPCGHARGIAPARAAESHAARHQVGLDGGVEPRAYASYGITLVYRKFSMIYGSSRRIGGLGCWGHYGRHSPSRSGSSMQP